MVYRLLDDYTFCDGCNVSAYSGAGFGSESSVHGRDRVASSGRGGTKSFLTVTALVWST